MKFLNTTYLTKKKKNNLSLFLLIKVVATHVMFCNIIFALPCRDLFLPNIGKYRPQLLIFDAASCHMSLPVIQLAIKENVHIISLPAKTTSFLQPVDQILSILVSRFSELAHEMGMSKFEFLVRESNFPPLLHQALTQSWTKDVIMNSFERTGI